LRVRGGSTAYRSYLKFTVTGLSGPVVSAQLRLWVSDPGPDAGGVWRVANQLLGKTTPWTESALHWSNAPAISGAPLATLGAVANGTWAVFDVTSAVTAEGTYSFALQTSNTDGVDFSSSEGTHAPELVLTTGAVLASRAAEQSAAKASAAPAEFARHFPNPTPGPSTFEFTVPRPGTVQLDIYDVRGSRLRRLERAVSPGPGTVVWDGRDGGGSPVSSGIYMYELRFESERQRGKIVLRR
jgi:hypothetical protein